MTQYQLMYGYNATSVEALAGVRLVEALVYLLGLLVIRPCVPLVVVEAANALSVQVAVVIMK